MFKKIEKFKYLISVFLGLILGFTLKEKCSILKPLGTIFVNLIFTIVVPLVFLTIVSNISKMESRKKLKKILSCSFIIFVITLFITGIFTVVCTFIYNPHINITLENANIEKINIVDKLVSMLTVTDFIELFKKSNILALIVFSIILGISISFLDERKKISEFVEIGNKVINKYLHIIMLYAPIGICAYLASFIGEFGSELLIDYVKIIIMYLVIGILNILVFHTIYLFIAGGKKMVVSYYENIINLIAISFSTQSSVITMPTNINTLNKMGVTNNVVGVTTPIATLINMQGNVIENTLKMILLYSIFGMQINIFTYVYFIVIAIFAGMITAGIPGGGVISNTIMVMILGLPTSALPIIITIEWLLDAPATTFNILSDTSTVPLIDKMVKKIG